MPTDDESDVCGRCAERCGTCCTLTSSREELCFPLSSSERKAMLGAGAEAKHFARQINTSAFFENMGRLFPGESERLRVLFPVDGAHDRLALSKNGSCLLLGPKGCRLPRQARPLYCRLFPFWIRAGKQLYFEFSQCQAQIEGQGGGGLLARLGMSNAMIRNLYSDLRKAWGLPE